MFQKYYEEYKLPYKLVLFDHLDFCENLEQFYEVFNYFSEKVAQAVSLQSLAPQPLMSTCSATHL